MFDFLVIISTLLIVLITISSIYVFVNNQHKSDFVKEYEASQRLKVHYDEFIEMLKFCSKRDIHCFIVDELPLISDAEIGAVYIIVNSFSEVDVVYCKYFTVVGDMWMQCDAQVDMKEYL